MKKEDKKNFDKFIKKGIEFYRPDFYNSNKDNDKKNKNDEKAYKNNWDYPFSEKEKDYNFMNKSSEKEKNKDKVLNFNNYSSSKNKEIEKEKIKQFMKEYQLKRKNKNHEFNMNPFHNVNIKNTNINNNIRISDENKHLHHNIENEENKLPFAHLIDGKIVFIKNDINNHNQKILENSRYQEIENKYSDKYRNDFNNIMNTNKIKKINKGNLDKIEPEKDGKSFIYSMFGILGSCGIFIFLYKNGILSKLLKNNSEKINFNSFLDYIESFRDKIKISEIQFGYLKDIIISGIDYLNKIFEEYNDVFRILSIILIIIFLWIIVKFFIRCVNNCLKKEKEKYNVKIDIEEV